MTEDTRLILSDAYEVLLNGLGSAQEEAIAKIVRDFLPESPLHPSDLQELPRPVASGVGYATAEGLRAELVKRGAEVEMTATGSVEMSPTPSAPIDPIAVHRENALAAARAAAQSRDPVLQVILPLLGTDRSLLGMFTGGKDDMRRWGTHHGATLSAIEAEGWRLEHADYVFHETGSVSRDKLLSSGQTAAVTGEVVGIYIFRRAGGV
jgi:hypothetical protein